MTERTAVELMRTLDEKFMNTSIAFEAMRPAAVLIIDPAPYRLADGSLDRPAIMRVFASAVDAIPAMRQRMMMSPLGLTAPLWVPDKDFDLAFHVRFHPQVLTPSEFSEVLSGRANGPMLMNRPLWDFRLAELPSGDLAIVGRVQHASGDGFFALRIADALVTAAPSDSEAASDPVAPLGEVPRTRFGMLVVVGRRWLAEQGSLGAAWKEYWRKPFGKRLRRWAGRLARPIRNRQIDRKDLRSRYLPKRLSAFRIYPFAEVRARARELHCGVSDLTVAASLFALARARQDLDEVALMVPISRRVAGTRGGERNNISMARVAVSTRLDLEEIAAIVKATVKEAMATEPRPGEGRGHVFGYASYLPWRRERARFGPAELKSVVLWPTLDPRDPVAVFTGSYADEFTVAITVSDDLDLDAFFDEVERGIVARAEVAA